MNDAVTITEFDTAMKRLGLSSAVKKIALAVSGGGDSLALTLLMQDWAKTTGADLLALTVDHKLRAGSTREAEKVQAMLQARGIAHEILVWAEDKPLTSLPEKARAARYKLLHQACRERGFPFLAVAHNAEDQIETFWMRLAHGSGLDGLSAMAPVREMNDVTVIRPLLGFSRERLRATCAHHQLAWVEDPSNLDKKYLRVKLRQFEDLLAGEGLTPARLAQTVQKLSDAGAALQVMTSRAFAECVLLHAEGYATLKTESWKNFPREIQRRVLAQVLLKVSPQDYPAGFELLEQTRLDLLAPSFAGKTLFGCEMIGEENVILILREAAAAEGHAPAKECQIWDNRFAVSGFDAESLCIGILGEAGFLELRKNNPSLPAMDKLHFKVKKVLPAVWQGENLLAVPHINYYSPFCPSGVKTGRILFSV